MLTIKYAPQRIDQIIGQDDVVRKLKSFVENYKNQPFKAAILYGATGVGKTCSVYALAQELDYEVLEINSSDLRNKDQMESFLGSALGQQSLFFRPKLILIDEIDNLSGTRDRGAVQAIISAIENSTFPIILTVNDFYESKIKSLTKKTLNLSYLQPDYKEIVPFLEKVCQQEGIEYEQKALNSLARQCNGDIRSVLIDLQCCTYTKKLTFEDVNNLSDRKREENILDALRIIFKSSSVENSLNAFDNVDLDIREIFSWLDQNLPLEYTDAQSLYNAYEMVSRADIFNKRIMRWQHWRFLVYINNFLTAGISQAKVCRNNNFVKYSPSMRGLKIWQANMRNAKKEAIAEKLALVTHTSKKVALEQVEYLKKMYEGGSNFKELELTKDEEDWLR
jgi:replication factor C large subunit